MLPKNLAFGLLAYYLLPMASYEKSLSCLYLADWLPAVEVRASGEFRWISFVTS